jgi:hypothetical protein
LTVRASIASLTNFACQLGNIILVVTSHICAIDLGSEWKGLTWAGMGVGALIAACFSLLRVVTSRTVLNIVWICTILACWTEELNIDSGWGVVARLSSGSHTAKGASVDGNLIGRYIITSVCLASCVHQMLSIGTGHSAG